MPEVVTKHPEVVKQVLESAGARCGAGAPQKILTKCPPAQFCALPGGEICVYPPSGLPEMTQLSRAELCGGRTEAGPPDGSPAAGAAASSGILAAVPIAIVAAAVLRRRRHRR